MAYETSKELDYADRRVTTPLGEATHQTPTDNIVLATLLRAGLPMHEAFLSVYDKAENAFVSAYRKYSSNTEFEIEIEYLAAPSLKGKTLILVDPMLATGRSMLLGYKALQSHGEPSKIILASIIASRQAVDYIEKNFLSETISSKKLSELCGISYSYIKKIFNLKYKTSPKKFCLLLKMNYACDLLSSGKYNISQTAEMCGYQDVYFFSHQFKLHVGVSPANFIKNYKSSK